MIIIKVNFLLIKAIIDIENNVTFKEYVEILKFLTSNIG